MLFFLFIIIALCAVHMIYSIRSNKAAYNKRVKEKEALLKKLNATVAEEVSHFHGLPLPEGTVCTLYFTKDKLVASVTTNQEFFIKRGNIIDVSIHTSSEIQSQYVSSAGGAVAGAMLFGAIGAIVGGRPKNMQNKIVSIYLIVSYISNGSPQYIAFDVTGVMNRNLFVADFLNNPIKATIQKEL